MFRLGIDLGGTKIEGIVLDLAGAEVFRKRIDTERDRGYDHILNQLGALYTDLARHIDNVPHTVGIGTPGAISQRTGLLKNSNIVCLNGQPLKADLESRLGRKIEIQNDANCFAMAEALHGAGKGRTLVFGIIMGTGCGGGIVYKGEVFTGPQSIAGEWGHTSIDPNGPLCFCGNRGCVETYISGAGAEARYAERYGEKKTFAQIEAAYRAGDQRATEFMNFFFQKFGRSVANLLNILDPDIVVIGGGVSKVKSLYREGVTEVAKQVFSDSLETPIVENKLGDSAGVIGAALVGI